MTFVPPQMHRGAPARELLKYNELHIWRLSFKKDAVFESRLPLPRTMEERHIQDGTWMTKPTVFAVAKGHCELTMHSGTYDMPTSLTPQPWHCAGPFEMKATEDDTVVLCITGWTPDEKDNYAYDSERVEVVEGETFVPAKDVTLVVCSGAIECDYGLLNEDSRVYRVPADGVTFTAREDSNFLVLSDRRKFVREFSKEEPAHVAERKIS